MNGADYQNSIAIAHDVPHASHDEAEVGLRWKELSDSDDSTRLVEAIQAARTQLDAQRRENELLRAKWEASTEGKDEKLQKMADDGARKPLVIETKHYTDGSSATGPAPLPDLSPRPASPLPRDRRSRIRRGRRRRFSAANRASQRRQPRQRLAKPVGLSTAIPAPPKGFVLDDDVATPASGVIPPPPKGFALDSDSDQTASSGHNEPAPAELEREYARGGAARAIALETRRWSGRRGSQRRSGL